MIPRYSRPEIAHIWDIEHRFSLMMQIEIYVAEAQASLEIIPQDAYETIKSRAKFSIDRIAEIEKETQHDVIAFLQNLSENIGEESARYLHRGLTSSDVLDTAFALQLKDSADILIADLESVLASLKEKALAYKMTPCIGRSHGIHGEPITMGLKFLNHFAVFERHLERLKKVKDDISTCALSGPMGNFTNIDPRVESYVAEKLGLRPEPISTQVIPRDRHAAFFSTLGLIAASIESFVTEIRHLQRTEVGELAEGFGKKQKGSSAMPHKRNPVLSENLTGLSRYIRSLIVPALENVVLWHERDISHSSVERIIAPDMILALDFALSRLSSLIQNLDLFPEKMTQNMDLTRGAFYSGTILLALTDAGCEKSLAYDLVQKNAFAAHEKRTDFVQEVCQDAQILIYLTKDQITEICSQAHFNRHVDFLFDRVL